MIASTPPLRVFRAQRPSIVRSAISLLMLAIAGVMFLEAPSLLLRSLSWASIAFTIIVIIRLITRFVSARDITLTDEGFWLGKVGAGLFTCWNEVKHFGVVDMKRQSFVVYALTDTAAPDTRNKKRLHGLPADVSGYFPPSSEITPQDLLALLNASKAKHG